MPKLKNYTTMIQVSRSIGEIHEFLIEFGAEKIMLDIRNKETVGVSFIMKIKDIFYPYKLSVKPESVQEFLWNEYKSKRTNRTKKTRDDFKDEANRITWRIQRDYLHSLLSIIATEQVNIGTALMGFLMVDVNNGKTLGDKFENGELNKLLPSHKLI